ncbi:rRNA maturation RNase YbeY [Niabella insulamsoli]|uniref:rRNA maturation RNase YbeY n=1 Tax=Niabella insulamsoli TaxID=3144874 RepID=UPI0031FE1A68
MDIKNYQISFHEEKPARLLERKRLKAFIAAQLSLGGRKEAEVNIIFCSDDYLLEINRTHLQHDYYTDIITFELSKKGATALLSDLFISVDRVRDNAKTLKSTYKAELHRVVFHGILHLLGYKDKTERETKKMRAMEEAWLKAYFG